MGLSRRRSSRRSSRSSASSTPMRGFLVAEQNTNMRCAMPPHGYIMSSAAPSWTARPGCCARTRTWLSSIFGVAEGNKKSFREVKSYSARKALAVES